MEDPPYNPIEADSFKVPLFLQSFAPYNTRTVDMGFDETQPNIPFKGPREKNVGRRNS